MTAAERAKRGSESKWHSNAKGKLVPPVLQDAFLEFLTTPPEERPFPSEAEWCKHHGVSIRTKAQWKKHDKFILEWNRRVQDKYAGPDTYDKLMDRTLNKALGDGPDALRAIELYMKLVDRMKPPEVKLVIDPAKQAATLSDEELAEQIEALRRPQAIEATRVDE